MAQAACLVPSTARPRKAPAVGRSAGAHMVRCKRRMASWSASVLRRKLCSDLADIDVRLGVRQKVQSDSCGWGFVASHSFLVKQCCALFMICSWIASMCFRTWPRLNPDRCTPCSELNLRCPKKGTVASTAQVAPGYARLQNFSEKVYRCLDEVRCETSGCAPGGATVAKDLHTTSFLNWRWRRTLRLLTNTWNILERFCFFLVQYSISTIFTLSQ